MHTFSAAFELTMSDVHMSVERGAVAKKWSLQCAQKRCTVQRAGTGIDGQVERDKITKTASQNEESWPRYSILPVVRQNFVNHPLNVNFAIVASSFVFSLDRHDCFYDRTTEKGTVRTWRWRDSDGLL